MEGPVAFGSWLCPKQGPQEERAICTQMSMTGQKALDLAKRHGYDKKADLSNPPTNPRPRAPPQPHGTVSHCIMSMKVLPEVSVEFMSTRVTRTKGAFPQTLPLPCINWP